MTYTIKTGNASRRYTQKLQKVLHAHISQEQSVSYLYDLHKDIQWLLKKRHDFRVPDDTVDELIYKEELVNDCLKYNLGMYEAPVRVEDREELETPWVHPFDETNTVNPY